MTPNEALLSVERLHQLLEVDTVAGTLIWKHRTRDDAKRTNWNAKHAGKPALAYKSPHGYLVGDIFAKRYLAHRVIWAMAYGQWPIGQIDHINGVRDDNRLINLRDVSVAENAKNRSVSAKSITGHVGVYYTKSNLKYVATIKSNGVLRHLGSFSKLQDAVDARARAQLALGFHPNHGKPQEERADEAADEIERLRARVAELEATVNEWAGV